MSQRLTFVLSEISSVRERPPAPCTIHNSIHSLPTRASSANTPVSTTEETKQHHVIQIEPPSLPKRRAYLTTCIFFTAACWCVATTVMSLLYVVRGGTIPEALTRRVVLQTREDVHRRCALTVRTSEAEASRAELVAALALTVSGLNTDRDVAVTARGRHVFDVVVEHCDRIVEDSFAGEALVGAWNLNLSRMRGAKLSLSDGPFAQVDPSSPVSSPPPPLPRTPSPEAPLNTSFSLK